MKQLRLVTILATWLLMFVTMVVPVGFFSVKEDHDTYFSLSAIHFALILWFFYGSPLLVSGIISLFLKRTVPLVILLLSTIGYGIWAFYSLYLVIVDGNGLVVIILFWVAPFSLVFLIPVWVIALILNVIGKKEANALPGHEKQQSGT